MVVAARYRGDERSVTLRAAAHRPGAVPDLPQGPDRSTSRSPLVIVAVILLVGGGTVWSSMYGVARPDRHPVRDRDRASSSWIDRRWVQDPDGWDPRTVASIGPDVDISTLDGLADQLIGPSSDKVVRVTTSVLAIGPGYGDAARAGFAVERIVEAARRIGDVEQLLPEIAQLIVAVLIVEGDQVAERSKRGAAQAGQVRLDVDLELAEQHGQLVLVDRFRIRRLDGIDQGGAERSHRHPGHVLVTTLRPASAESLPEKSRPIDPDPRPPKRLRAAGTPGSRAGSRRPRTSSERRGAGR